MKSLISYKPNGSVSLWENIDTLFDRFFDEAPVWSARRPLVDVREEEDRYVLEAELPGLSDKDIDVKIEDNLLTLSSTTTASSEEKRDGYLMRERRSAGFQRSFVLPRDVDREKVDASFKNGVLALSLHKRPEAKPRSIQIKAE